MVRDLMKLWGAWQINPSVLPPSVVIQVQEPRLGSVNLIGGACFLMIFSQLAVQTPVWREAATVVPAELLAPLILSRPLMGLVQISGAKSQGTDAIASGGSRHALIKQRAVAVQ